MKNAQSQKIAIVHDWLYGGGAEKVVEQLHKIYPEAPIYTSYCTDEWRKKLNNQVVTGYLQRWPFSRLRKFLPLFRQWWFARIDLQEYDIVIASSGNGEAKFVKPRKNSTFICYCHTPPHFYWRKYSQYLKNPGFGSFDWLAKLGLKFLIKPLRKRDYTAAQNPDYFYANSNHIAKDIKKFYSRNAEVIHPPIDNKRFNKIQPDLNLNKFIIWGRHVPDKRIDIAIKACNELELSLTIIGSGVETKNLKKLAGPTIEFTDRINDEEMDEKISNASAFIFTSEEDFGISPVEAMAAGLPVIAYKAGGALDYVSESITGTYFNEQTPESLIKVLKKFKAKDYNSKKIKNHVQKFSEDNFQKKVKEAINVER